MILGLFVDAFAIYGVASVALRDGDRAMYIASTFFLVTGVLLVWAFIDARLEARDHRRNRRLSRLDTEYEWKYEA